MKARLFVLTIQDHYHDLFENVTHVAAPESIASDEWALEYLGLSSLRPLMEAFDDDASGYVSIAEVNRLMDMRPSSLGWRYQLCSGGIVTMLTLFKTAYRTGSRIGQLVRLPSLLRSVVV